MNLEDVAAELDNDRGIRRLWWAVIVVFALGMAACIAKGADRPPDPKLRAQRFPGFGEVALKVDDKEFCALHAADPATRGRGLMQQRDLAGYDAMVFSFDEDSTSTFYMFNTPLPLSIAWFDARGRYVSSADMKPCTQGAPEACLRYHASAAYRYAIEVPKGKLDELGIRTGSRIRVGGRCT